MKCSTENGVPQLFSKIPKQLKQHNSPKISKAKANRVKAVSLRAVKLSSHHSSRRSSNKAIPQATKAP